MNRHSPRFSIVIATYNTTDVLRQCVESLENQSTDRNAFELIVVNDGDKDITKDVGASGHRFKTRTFHQDHQGPAAARNLGIRNARGEIILFLDDDSLPTKGWFNATVKAWETHPECDGIGGCIAMDPMDSIYCRVNADFFNWYLEQHLSSNHSSFLVTCNAGYKKSSLEKVGLFDDRFKKASGEDRDLNIKILKTGGKLRLDKNILVYHDRDLTFRSFVTKNFNYGKAAYNIYKRYPAQKYVSSKGYISFFVSIIKKYSTLNEKLITFCLLTLSQVATTVGYLAAFLSKEDAETPAPGSPS